MTDTARAQMMKIREFRESEGMAEWPVLAEGAVTFFPTESLATSARLVEAIAAIPGVDDHTPDIDIRSDGVTVKLLTRSAEGYGMSRLDVEYGRAISRAAARLGLGADPTAVQSVMPVVIAANDITAIMPFWKAMLGYVERPDSPEEDIIDPHDRGVGIWFEKVEGQRSERNRMHIAVWVPHDQAQARVDAAVAAGGRVIFDEYAPAWWTLMDPEGNEGDIATSLFRDEE